MASKVLAVGKKAKKRGCCQCIRPLFLFFIFPRECLSVRFWVARNEVVVRMRTGNDELVVVLRDILKGLANLRCCRCGDYRQIEAQKDMIY